MKKRVIYISLGIVLVLLICLGIWFVVSQNSGKNLYFYASTDGYFYQDEKQKDTQDFYVYRCKNKDCEVLSNQQKKAPYFLIQDNGYVVVNFLEKNFQNLSISSNEYLRIEEDETFALLIKREPLYEGGYETFDLYSYPQNKVIPLENNGEHDETIFKNFSDFLVFRTQTQEGPSSVVKGPDQIYDSQLTLVSDENYVYGMVEDGSLVLAPVYENFFEGGINKSGYLELKQFSMLDSSYTISYTSPEYLSIQSFIYDMNTQENILYYLAVDHDNVLKLYTLEGMELASLESWGEDKNVCMGELPTLSNEQELEIIIGYENSNGRVYRYNFETKQLSMEELDYAVCTK